MTTYVHVRALALASLFAAAPVLAQDCNPGIPLTKPDSRYTDNGDGTVTDTVTNFTWKRCVEGQTWDGATCTGTPEGLTWQQALQRPRSINAGTGYAGHRDWRVPSAKELATLFEFACYAPAINATMFPGTPSDAPHKTATPYLADPSIAWVANFYQARITATQSGFAIAKASPGYVRLVRD